jgi:adenosylmethionine-8-amino-7-oxononanoate aminotransferase
MNIMPPLCVTPEEIDQILSVLDLVIQETARPLGAETAG